MEQPKHTPGPWTIEMEPYGPESFDGFLSIESATQTICTDVSNCDAPLISAAPDLLEALEACFPYMHDLDAENFDDASAGIIEDYKLSEDFKKMKAALAKAKNVELAK